MELLAAFGFALAAVVRFFAVVFFDPLLLCAISSSLVIPVRARDYLTNAALTGR